VSGEIPVAAAVALSGAALIFLTGLLTGIWKWRAMLAAADHRAPIYVDTLHRAALMYAFASALCALLAALSAWPAWLNLAGVALLLANFGVTLAVYAYLGRRGDTTTQFSRRGWHTTQGMVLLILGEVGGFLILASGTAVTLWGGG